MAQSVLPVLGSEYFWGVPAFIIRRGLSPCRNLFDLPLIHSLTSFLEMVASHLPNFPSSFSLPPPDLPNAGGPSLSLQLGGINVNVGGSGGTGVYRGNGEVSVGVQGAEGIRDGVLNLFGKVKEGVDKLGLP